MKKMAGYTFFLIIFSINLFSHGNADEISDVVADVNLLTATAGLQYRVLNNSDETCNIIYDCSVASTDEGIIEIFDSTHPGKINTLIIQNCKNITLSKGDYEKYWNNPLFFIKEITIKNITTLKLENTEFNTKTISKKRKEVHITDIPNLILEENSLAVLKNVSLTLKNTTILNLKKRDISRGISQLHLENVKIKELEEEAISLDNKEAVFTMRDTHFEYIGSRAFFVNGFTVEICNNSFQYLDKEAFHINASEKFIFSGNQVQNMESSFHVISPNVQIVSNTFANTQTPWLNGIIVGDGRMRIKGVLNISRNSMKLYPENFYVMNSKNFVDVIRFKDNNFNCDCQYRSLNEITNPNSVMHILLKNSNNNVCKNLNNCSLAKVLRNMNEVCYETFKCSEEKSKVTTDEYLEMILSTLKNMAVKLDLLTLKVNSSKASTEINSVTENSNITDQASF